MVWLFNKFASDINDIEGSISGESSPNILVRTPVLSNLWSENLQIAPEEGAPVLVCVQQILKVDSFPTPGGVTEYEPFSDSRHYPATEIRLGDENGNISLALECRTQGIRLPDIHFIQSLEGGTTSYYIRDITSAQEVTTIAGGTFGYNTVIYSVRGSAFTLLYRQIEIRAKLDFFDGTVLISCNNEFAFY